MFYRRQQPPPPQRTLTVRLKSGRIVVSATQLLVAIYHFQKGQHEPDYTTHLMVADNPELAELYHPTLGWDLESLVSLLWRKIEVLKHLDLRDEALREKLGLRTVSAPSQKIVRQEKRTAEEAMQLIQEYVIDHPNCTRLEIARGINRKKTGHFIAQVEWLVRLGILFRTEVELRENVFEFHYIFIGKSDD